ncbi:MAG: hypothetical protein ACRDZW_08275 [Acidimicrobiales bacterium]
MTILPHGPSGALLMAMDNGLDEEAQARRLIEQNLAVADAYLAAFTTFAEGRVSAA